MKAETFSESHTPDYSAMYILTSQHHQEQRNLLQEMGTSVCNFNNLAVGVMPQTTHPHLQNHVEVRVIENPSLRASVAASMQEWGTTIAFGRL